MNTFIKAEKDRIAVVKYKESRLLITFLDTVDYSLSSKLQNLLASNRKQDLIPDLILLQQHNHTYTIGKRGTREDILLSDKQLALLGIDVHHTDRGGQVTYHGPGQIVGYPVMDIRPYGGPAKYVSKLEDVLISSVNRYGVTAERKTNLPGVWISGKKIASIGLKISGGVSTHGFSLNVNNDLSYFENIITCGIKDLRVTSLENITGSKLSISHVSRTIKESFQTVFGREIVEVHKDSLVDLYR